MKTFVAFIILFIYSNLGLKAQELSHQVLVTIAGVNQSSANEFSYTVGESAVEIISSGDWTLTQGFQQPRIIFSNDVTPAGNGVDVYPNPFRDFINIEFFGDSARTLNVEIMNLSGVVLIRDRFNTANNYRQIKPYDSGNFTNGVYIVRILSTDRRINRVFKIEKF